MMNIILASDNNFVQHCCVTMTSILENNKNVTFYLLTEGLTKENIQILTNQVQKYASTLHICLVDSNIVKKFPMPSYMSSHISVATYYRLLVTSILPIDVDKAIYMDCDIVVRHSLEDLWNTDISSKALGAIYQYNESGDHNNSWSRLNISRKKGYFNAGVLLINLDYWRKNDVEQRLMDFIANNTDKIHSHDQDTLNAVLQNEVMGLDMTWNCLPFFFDPLMEYVTFPEEIDYSCYKKVRKNPAVVHYASKPKPWQAGCESYYYKEYYRYVDLTPWKGFRPKFNLRNIWKYRIYPRTIKKLSLFKYKLSH